MVNKTILVGNLGKTPEETVTPGGMQIVSFSVATSKNIKRGDNWESKTTWHNIKAFNNQAEYCKKLVKGNRVYLEGEIDYQTWEKDGVKHNKTEIILNTIRNLSPKNEDGQGSQPQQNKPQNNDADSSELPF